MMRCQFLVLIIGLLAAPAVGWAQAPLPPSSGSIAAPFILPGHDYHIRFPPGQNPFVYSTSGVTESYEKLPDGSKANRRPAPWSMKVSLDIFRVVQFAGESWVFVELPASAKDYALWSGKHRAKFLLQQPQKLDPERLRRLRESANKEIKLMRTWLNIDHAITINKVSEDSLGITEK